ncbi:MAG: hypothetical protein GDA38_22045 [Hormoscilla sp. SP12CHS1]|nr:hypothetical protein [Hormoscilla sp. SP12CHS1]
MNYLMIILTRGVSWETPQRHLQEITPELLPDKPIAPPNCTLPMGDHYPRHPNPSKLSVTNS